MNELLRASERLVVTKRHECSERTTKLLQLSDQFGVVSGREYYEHCVVFAKEKKEKTASYKAEIEITVVTSACVTHHHILEMPFAAASSVCIARFSLNTNALNAQTRLGSRE